MPSQLQSTKIIMQFANPRFILVVVAALWLPAVQCGNIFSSTSQDEVNVKTEDAWVTHAKETLERKSAQEEERRLVRERRFRAAQQAAIQERIARTSERLEQEQEYHATLQVLEAALKKAKRNCKTAADRKKLMQVKNQLAQHRANPPVDDARRQYGEYKCYECGNRWSSGYARQTKYQKCRCCETENRPLKLTNLLSSVSAPGAVEHDGSRCQVCIEKGKRCNRDE